MLKELLLISIILNYNSFTMKDLRRQLAHLFKWPLFILELFYDAVVGVFVLELP